MLDARFVRENVSLVEEALRKRASSISLSGFLEIEEERRGLIKETDELRNKRNVVSEEIGRLKKQKEDASSLMAEMKGVSEKIKESEEKLNSLEGRTRDFLLNIPNIPNSSVPVGGGEADNVEIRKWGKLPDFGESDFQPLNHWDIAEMHGIIDFDRASKIAGARF